jgi:hypothetical protein
MTPPEPPIVDRAMRLLRIGAVTQVTVVLFVNCVLLLRDPTNSQVVMPAVIGMAGSVAATFFAYLFVHDKPNYWQGASLSGSALIIVSSVGPMLGNGDYLRAFQANPGLIVLALAIAAGVVLVNFLPVRQATHLVLAELSDDVVHSALVLRFRSRTTRRDVLHVTHDSIEILNPKERQRRNEFFQIDEEYPLADVSAVTVRKRGAVGYFRVPGARWRETRVTPGYVVEIDLPGGRLVFPAEDCERLAWFVEKRRDVLRAAGDEADGP